MRVNITGSAYIVDTAPQQFPSTPDDDRRLPKGWVIASELSFQQPIAVLITSQQREAIIKQTQTRLLRLCRPPSSPFSHTR
jgi:hypothetical protein